jgi:SRSO17 transposase
MEAEMGLESVDGASRFNAFVEALTSVIGHADRAAPLRDYCAGLLASEGRRSVEPMAAVTAPAQVSVQHQKLLHFIANGPWSDERVLTKVRELVLPAIERHGPIEVWIIDDTSFPKHGPHSVGARHQYCGQLGKQAVCQVAVTLSIANHHASLPIAYRLYLPKDWADDAARRKKVHVPDEIRFKTKPQIALEQARAACAADIPRGVVLMDASYGSHIALRTGVKALGLAYVAAIVGTIKVRAACDGLSEARVSVKNLALSLPKGAWQAITWREGAADHLRSRFARVRVRASPTRGRTGQPEETLLIEWPENEPEPTKYWLSSLEQTISFQRLVDIAKMRWRVERDYQDLKQEIGLGHYEGRGWQGFHHHGTMCIAAYAFLISERETIPPSGPGPAAAVTKAAVPHNYRPRGAPDPARTSRPKLDRDSPSQTDCRDHPNPATMPMLRTQPGPRRPAKLMTQSC